MMDEKMLKLKNEIDEKIEDFLQNSDELKRFIAFRKNNFYDYSIRNTILIYKQNPNATLVVGLKKWNELGALIFGTHFDLDTSGTYKYLSLYRRGVDIEKFFEKVLGIMEQIIYGIDEKQGIQDIISGF